MVLNKIVLTVALVAVAILLTRGEVSAEKCIAYDYCDQRTPWCVANNAVVSVGVGLSLGATRAQCAITQRLTETSNDRGICHAMAGSTPVEIEHCMMDNSGAALLVILVAVGAAWVVNNSIAVVRQLLCVGWQCLRALAERARRYATWRRN